MRPTEELMQATLASSLYDWRRYITVPNVSWGLGIDEADLIALSDSGWLTEIEIKISLADLRAEAKKYKYKRGQSRTASELIQKRYIAIPRDILRQKRRWLEIETDIKPLLPEGFWLIIVDIAERAVSSRARIEIPAPKNPRARMLDGGERLKLMRLGYLRFWARMEAARRMVTIGLEQAEASITADEMESVA